MAPAAFSGIPKFGQSLFLQYCHSPPPPAGRLPNCVFIYFCIFPAPRAHWRGVGREAEAGSQGEPKKNGQGGSSSPHSPEAGRKPGSVGLAGKRVGAGGRKGGGQQHRPPPLLGEIKNSHVQRVAASATKSVLSRGSCKLFAAPGNQHLSLQNPPQPLPALARSCRCLSPTHICHVNNQ